ncbi:hypothetical protein IOCL2690_000231900 [Leishmania lindenbergi]|uniref:Uncharacterized protein n=1 Tax=Leishmania lindenbergi TaxID=651832 RepID=A0AAW3AQE7_9TRYP
MVHAITATSTQGSLKSVSTVSDAVRDVSLSITTKQLLTVTRDVVILASRAIEVRRRRVARATGTPDNQAVTPPRSAAHGATGGGLENTASSMGLRHRRHMASDAATVDEKSVLLHLMRTTTRFSAFEELCAWIEQLLARDGRLVFSEIPDVPSRSSVLSPQQ